MISELKILSPLSGQIWPLERVPDPVFAQKLVGDGISIDPTDAVLLAACDGEVASLATTGHAVTLRTEDGLEVLMHIGIDTVTLKGEGFHPRVKLGDRVHAGDPLIAFDLDFLATHAKSLLTQVVVANTDRVVSWERASGCVSAGKDPLLTITVNDGPAAAAEAGTGTIISEAVVIPNASGLHARPAAVLANLAKGFQSAIKLHVGDRQANARSVTAIMALDVEQGAKIQVVAQGPDAAAAVEKLTQVLAAGCGDEGCAPAPAPATITAPPLAAPSARTQPSDPNLLAGVPAAPGLAVGEVFQVRRLQIDVPEPGTGVDAERRRLATALATARGQIAALRATVRAKADSAKAAIFAAHEELTSDPDLLDMVESLIAKGKSAGFAWKKAVATHADRLAGLHNDLLAQRANDVRDVGLRVLSVLTGADVQPAAYPPNTVLIAEELTPSEMTALDRSSVLGLCTIRGGATSHVAILARSFGIPAIAGMEPAALDVANGTVVILDGNTGTLQLHASPEELTRVRGAQERSERRRRDNLSHAAEPAITLDGRRIEVLANIAGVDDAARIAALGAEGVGLLRSEFLFMGRADAPTEEQQFTAYTAIVEAVGPERPLIIRTLDVGGDKPLAYLPIPREDNPFLGERGLRVGLDRPDLLRAQLRAILRAAAFGRVSVMFPMVTTMDELREAKAMLAEEAADLGVPAVAAGIMVEVPAAAIMAPQFAREAAFFSIGTNDLTQYTLAMDRGHPKLAPLVDGLNPAVLQLIAHTVEGARRAGKRVGVCGGIASDRSAVPILLGLGVDELSVSLPAIPAVKAQIRALRKDDCERLADRALAAESAQEVRALIPDSDAQPGAGNVRS
jgi:phosphocarrier protein FPr